MTDHVLSFEEDVLVRSESTPVLVDFWAPWCGPCKMLAPVVERLAAEPGARWSLMKVNTEENPELATKYGVRGIPNLKLFHRRAVIAELSGAVPESQLRAWLSEHLPTPKRDTMAKARELLHAGRAADATKLLEPLLAADPGDLELAVLTARALLFIRPHAALALVASIPPGSAWSDGAEIVRALAAVLAAEPGAPEGSSDQTRVLHDKYCQGIDALRRQDFRTAAANLVAVLIEKPNYANGHARAACRALFQHLGVRHPITEDFSRAYSMAVNV